MRVEVAVAVPGSVEGVDVIYALAESMPGSRWAIHVTNVKPKSCALLMNKHRMRLRI
jgi:hypothetical protein